MAAKDFRSDQEAGNEESTLLQLNGAVIISPKKVEKFSSRSNDGDDDDDDLFEFFSEEFSTSSNATAENIVFCGKLIPFKDVPPRVESNSSGVQKGSSSSTSALLPWRPTNKAKPSLRKGEPEAKGSKSFACDYTSIGKVSLLRCTTKSRWFLFMFGMPKVSTAEMELRDIRNRQSRRGPATMFPAPEDGKEVGMKGKRNCKGMWKLFRSISLVLGCRSSKIANDVVKAAFV
ncbi:hypothetical protein E2542_SST23077 [Spatholobus suberectus]|nr:hypothetical protein E2542_SST23077 [Spatholobus suberectus]